MAEGRIVVDAAFLAASPQFSHSLRWPRVRIPTRDRSVLGDDRRGSEVVVQADTDDVILDPVAAGEGCESARSRYGSRERIVHSAEVDIEVFELRRPVVTNTPAKTGLDARADRPTALIGGEACRRRRCKGCCRCVRREGVIGPDAPPRAATGHVP